jgi:methionyl-tRNA formyltransferase
MSADRIVMVGCHELGGHLLPRLVEAGINVDLLLTISRSVAEAEGVSGYVDLEPLARQLGIPVRIAERYSLEADDDLAMFERERFSVLIQGGWQRLIPRRVLDALEVGAIGVHGSADPLPKGRGRSPLNWSILEGRKRFVLQFFLMTAGVDDGAVFASEDFDLTPFDTIRTAYYKNAIITARVLARDIPRLRSGELRPRPQVGIPSYYSKRTPDDGKIDWEEMDVWQIHDLVRAVTRPYPGAFGLLDGQERRIWRAQVFDTRILYEGRPYGAVVERFDDALIVNCRGGLLLIEDFEPR